MLKKRVSVIIPTYNGLELLKKYLPQIMSARMVKANRIYEVIVVDDASKDATYEYLKSNYPSVRLIRHKKNRGFSAAVNTGARSSRGDLFVLLNNDVLPTKDFLIPVFEHFDDPSVFGISFGEKGFSWARAKFEGGYVKHEPGLLSTETHPTFWVSGGSGIFRRDYWMKLGGMDEKLFSPFYWEDIDLCYRAMKRGYRLLWEPTAVVEHKHESTISRLPIKKVTRIRERNELIFIWKNITSNNLFKKHISGMFRRLLTHPGYFVVLMAALIKLKAIAKARRKEKKEAKVSDEAIFARF